jgi:polyisoprenoid-binding protein YceI
MFCMAVVLPIAMWAADGMASREIDTQKSVMTVRVFKSGLLSAFGHEHTISAPIRQGTFNERDYAAELAVDAGKMRVMDKDVSEKDRAEIQETMLGPKVLDAGKFPEIRFRSTAVESKAGPLDREWRTEPARTNPTHQAGGPRREWTLSW